MKKLLQPYIEKALLLKNHIVMAPMTRSRALGNIPNEWLVTYYGQRSEAGLIITEGTAPMPEALGYARIPGVYTPEQVQAWSKVATAVHKGGSKIFMQIMHTGRIGHVDNLPGEEALHGPSEIRAAGQIFTDTKGMQDHSAPLAMTLPHIETVVAGFAQAAKNAVQAGFDGVEIHGANGYLLEQFLNPNINDRNDHYGGSIENRSRLLLGVVEAVSKAIGAEKTALRISPFSTLGDLTAYAENEVKATYLYLAAELEKLGIVYLHINLNSLISAAFLEEIRELYTGTLLLTGGFDILSAEKALQESRTDLVGFGRNFISNPDLVSRIQAESELIKPDFTTLYTADTVGYIDYPSLKQQTQPTTN